MLEFIIFYMFVGVTFSILYKQTAGKENSSIVELYFLIPLFWIGYLVKLTYFNDDEK